MATSRAYSRRGFLPYHPESESKKVAKDEASSRGVKKVKASKDEAGNRGVVEFKEYVGGGRPVELMPSEVSFHTIQKVKVRKLRKKVKVRKR